MIRDSWIYRLRRNAFSAAIIMCTGLLALSCRTTLAEEDEAMLEPNVNQTYVVRKASVAPELKGQWEDSVWRQAEAFEVRHFHEKSSGHRPEVQGKALYTEDGLYIIFRVTDRFVISKHTKYQDPVCRDSCAEFFVQPKPDKGYFNLEVNCGGTFLLEYHERSKDGYETGVAIPYEQAKNIRIYHSMPATVFPEVQEKVTWYVEYFVPFSLFEHYVGALKPVDGQSWRANFYKCADESSHPHWAAWAPIAEKLSFHQPKFFGTIQFMR